MYDPHDRLQRLYAEWFYCRKCQLSERRTELQHNIVFGQGALRGIMFIGDMPGKEDEQNGIPFMGQAGKMLRAALQKSSLRYASYLTNTVCCRNCGPVILPDGTTQGFTHGGVFTPSIRNKAPNAEHMQACLPRLYEQIYLIDPLLIVCLGGEATKLLYKKPMSVVNESGTLHVISIPGRAHIPQLTEKKRAWTRKQGGELISPIELNQVRYLMMPSVHPSYALQHSPDLRMGNPMDKFISCMRLVAGLYRRHVYEMTGDTITQEELKAQDLIDASNGHGES